MEIDLLIRDAAVVTLDDACPRGRGVAVHHGRVVAVLGPDDDGALPAGVRARRVVDLDGATVVPGLADAHQHMAWFGQTLAEVDLTGARTLGALYDAVAARAATLPPGAFVVGSGYDDVAMGASPHRTGLDRAGGGRPVWLKHRSGHVSAVSSDVLRRAGLAGREAAVPEGGRVVRDADGDATGIVEESAQTAVGALLLPYPVDDLAAAVTRAAGAYAAQGLTHVTECGVGGGWIGRSPRELAAYQQVRDAGGLAVRVQVMPTVEMLHVVPGGPGATLDLGLASGFGDDDLRLGPMKIFFDGALSSRTAALRTPYVDRGGSGYLADDPALLHERVVAAHAAGWRVAAHAIGDRAVDAALDAFADAHARHPAPGRRHRLEHAALADDAAVARMAALDVTPVPQARFLAEIGDSMLAAVGPERASLLYRHASFLRAGLRVPGSTDRPCVADGHPLASMHAMTTRRTAAGHVLGPDERVDATTALRAHTVDAALVAGEADRWGRVAPGLLADLAVLSADPTTVDPELLPGLEVLATLRGGRATHGADRFPRLA